MDRYPEHRFVASQAQQFKWLEQQYPQLFDVIKGVGSPLPSVLRVNPVIAQLPSACLQKIDAGQFMPIGGSWVEVSPCTSRRSVSATY